MEREPLTIVCSAKGWIRALKGHDHDGAAVKYKEGDRGRFLIRAETTDRLALFATNGRFYTIACEALSRGRGHGEPVRLMIELGNDEDIVAAFVHRPAARLLVAASDGRGFLVAAEATPAQTRAGRQVLNVKPPAEACVCVAAEGDTVAVVGENRRLLVFPLDQVPTLARGRGVILQRHRDGGLGDATVFTLAEGLSWRVSGRKRTETDLEAWRGRRGQTGRLAPRGFPRSNRFLPHP